MHEDEIPVGRAKDLRGQRFGKLTVLYRVASSNHCTRWKCICDCGVFVECYANNLTNPCYTHSCGCSSERGKHNNHNGPVVDIAGQRYGRLIVIRDTGLRDQKREVFWECVCDCGNIVNVRGFDLRSGHTTSCGCLRSKGEEKIKSLLAQHHIEYVSQKTFATCVNARGNLLKFDFWMPTHQYCIEYDGNIHFQATPSHGWFNDEYKQDLVKRDECKNQWCKENNIPLIRVPYTKFDTLCIEDLLLETTKFRVV